MSPFKSIISEETLGTSMRYTYTPLKKWNQDHFNGKETILMTSKYGYKLHQSQRVIHSLQSLDSARKACPCPPRSRSFCCALPLQPAQLAHLCRPVTRARTHNCEESPSKPARCSRTPNRRRVVAATVAQQTEQHAQKCSCD